MTIPEMLLAVYATIGIVFLAAWRHSGPRLWRGTAALGYILIAAELISGGHGLAVSPMTVISLLAAPLAAFRARRAPGTVLGRGRVIRAIGRWTAATALVCVVLLDAAFVQVFDPLLNDPVRELLEES